MQNASTARPSESWAEVRAHEQVIRYRRSGVGQPVLVLRSSERSDAVWPELGDALAGGFRLIMPDVPPCGTDVAAWLSDFLEGLGLANTAVIATDHFCLAAIELVLLDRDRVARVVLVPCGQAAETGLDGGITTAARTPTVPLLVVRRGLPASEAVPLIARFLDGSG